MRRNRLAVGMKVGVPVCVALTLSIGPAVFGAQESVAPPASTLSCVEMETFLKTAKMGRQRGIPVGITMPSRTTLDDGRMQHDAAIQTTDVHKPIFTTDRGTQLNFRDSWQFNVAGYELAKILELNMVPPYVERNVPAGAASVSWWVSDAMMERERYLKKINPPEPLKWTQQMAAARVFHELIGDTDNNMTNLLITKDWRIWMIDFTRAFRRTKALLGEKQLTRTDRTLLANLRGLTREVLQEKLGRWLQKPEIDGVLARRDLIVRVFDNHIARKGEAAVLFDLPRTTEPCGTGLQ
jgi:hypothetical protein